MTKKVAIFFTFFGNILTTCSPDIGLRACKTFLWEKWRIVPMGQKTERWPYQIVIQTIIVKNIEKNKIFSKLFTNKIIIPPLPPKSILKWSEIKGYIPSRHSRTYQDTLTMLTNFYNIDFWGKGFFCATIKNSQYILTMIAWGSKKCTPHLLTQNVGSGPK